MSLIKNFIYFVLSIQEKILTRRLNRTLGVKTNSKRKKMFTDGCLLSLESVAEAEKNKMEEELALILKSAGYEPSGLLEYIKKHNTSVYYIANAKLLHSVKENEGFIYPQKGLKAIYLSLLTDKRPKFKTSEMFVLTKGDINKFFFIYHFYNWYTFKHGISGIDAESLEMLNKYLFNASDEEIGKLQLDDIYKLKDAVKQDKAAIEFVIKLCKDLDGTKNAFDKLKDGGATV